MSFLQLEQISKSYDHRRILTDFSLRLEAGELLAITGASGSGKSTLLNMIGLLEMPDSGRILLQGETAPSIHSRAAVLLRRNLINYVFQTHALISHLTVMENLLLAMRYLPGKTREKAAQAGALLAHFQLTAVARSKVASLSSGEAQRVSVIRSILKPGELILADEPTGSLDREMAEITFRMIRDLRDHYGKTVLLVTHDRGIAERCDRVIHLQ